MSIPLTACSAPAEPSAAPPATSSSSADSSAATPTPATGATTEALAQLEEEFDARLGVFAVDTGSGRTVEHRADERFGYASTHKALSAAAVLDATTSVQLDEVVPIEAADIVSNSPVTEQRVGAGITVRDAAAAAVRQSDNTAANVLFDRLGGPPGLDAALEELGDDVTQVDRTEPTLNDTAPGDPRDTSTPRALAEDLRAYVLEDALDTEDRALLVEWLTTKTTGGTLVRAGVPGDWVVGDKSGGGAYGMRNDIAVLWPPERDPIVVAVLSDRDEPDAEYDDALIAAAARLVVEALP